MVDARVAELHTTPHQHPTSPRTRGCVSHASSDCSERLRGCMLASHGRFDMLSRDTIRPGIACRFAESRWAQ